jgi:Tetratricopeptide repeat/Mitochondrial biogenesis AIM24
MSVAQPPNEPPSSGPPLGPGGVTDARYAEHLATAGTLVAGQRYEEAELEVMRALERWPTDLRALNLLALVRFKVGRLDEARATYREIAERAPNDPAVRRNLGLLALKAERADEAVAELELAAQLAPEDKRSWSYLGYAYTRFGDAVAAAAAFRRAGQHAVADELEAARPPTVLAEVSAPPQPAAAPAQISPPRRPTPIFGAPRVGTIGMGPGATVTASSPSHSSPSPSPPVPSLPPLVSGAGSTVSVVSSWNDAFARRSAETRAVPMVSFVLSSLGLNPGNGVAAMVKAGAPIRLSARDGAHVRADATLASVGVPPGERAVRRVRGRPSGELLGSPLRPFFRLTGDGEVWVAGTSNRWAALTLDEDILYVREDRVLAFDGAVSWEAGRIPGDGLRMLQFRGRGQVVLQLAGLPAAIRVSEESPGRVSRAALLGWVGRVVAHRPRREGPLQIVCEGDGVMLLEIRRSSVP